MPSSAERDETAEGSSPGLAAAGIPEEKTGGCWEGYSPEYLRVRLGPEAVCTAGSPVRVLIQDIAPRFLGGVMINQSEVD